MKNSKVLEWARNEIELAKSANLIEVENAKDEGEAETLSMTSEYISHNLENAYKLFELLSKQDHMELSSRELTMRLFIGMIRGDSFTPLSGSEEEWGKESISKVNKIFQNVRNKNVFKLVRNDGSVHYSYNKILDIINGEEVFSAYFEPYENLCDDYENPDGDLYSSKKYVLMHAIESAIQFPYIPVTYQYIWDFEKRDFIYVSIKGD